MERPLNSMTVSVERKAAFISILEYAHAHALISIITISFAIKIIYLDRPL